MPKLPRLIRASVAALVSCALTLTGGVAGVAAGIRRVLPGTGFGVGVGCGGVHALGLDEVVGVVADSQDLPT